jgi:Tfp pilus assembly protein PilF
VGREALLTRVRTDLTSTSTVALQALYGLGGVGKTQLAIEYCHRYGADYDLIGWINAERADLIPDELVTLASELRLRIDADTAASVGLLLAALGQRSRWLLVFDNAERPQDIRGFLPSTGGHVIVTSRQTGWSALGATVDVEVMTRTEAVTLLDRRVPGIDPHTAQAVAAQLGDLPLAVDQAAAYLDRTGIPPGDYLQLLVSSAEQLLSRGSVLGHDHTLATLWNLSYQQIFSASVPASQLLQLCAFLGPEPVPLDLFTSHVDLLPEPLARAAAEPVAFADAVGAIVGYSLARRSPGGLVVHRLVATAIRRPLSTRQRQSATGTVSALLRSHLPETVYQPESWPAWRTLLPHVLAATAVPEDSVIPDEADTVAWLLNHVSEYLNATGETVKARPLLQRALHIDEATHGPSHPNVARELRSLGRVLRVLGLPEEAEPALERALHIDETEFGLSDPRVGDDLHFLAEAVRDLGEPARAVPIYERALRIYTLAYGRGEHIAILLNDYAEAIRRLGQLDTARAMFEEALGIIESIHGRDHLQVGIPLNNLANVIRDLGHHEQAKAFYERSLAIGEAFYDPAHPAIAVRLRNLGVVLQELGRPDAAKSLYERALRIIETPTALVTLLRPKFE